MTGVWRARSASHAGRPCRPVPAGDHGPSIEEQPPLGPLEQRPTPNEHCFDPAVESIGATAPPVVHVQPTSTRAREGATYHQPANGALLTGDAHPSDARISTVSPGATGTRSAGVQQHLVSEPQCLRTLPRSRVRQVQLSCLLSTIRPMIRHSRPTVVHVQPSLPNAAAVAGFPPGWQLKSGHPCAVALIRH
jgi:hypothetical protein